MVVPSKALQYVRKAGFSASVLVSSSILWAGCAGVGYGTGPGEDGEAVAMESADGSELAANSEIANPELETLSDIIASKSDLGIGLELRHSATDGTSLVVKGDQIEVGPSIMTMGDTLTVELPGQYVSRNEAYLIEGVSGLEGESFLRSVKVASTENGSRLLLEVDSSVIQPDEVAREVIAEAGEMYIPVRPSLARAQLAAELDEINETPAVAETQAASETDIELAEAELPPNEEIAEAAEDKIEVAADSTPAEEELKEPLAQIQLSKVDLNTSTSGKGAVSLTLSSEAAFQLKKTAPTEFTLLIPGAKVTGDAAAPQVAAPGKSGIRSVRAVQQGRDVLVRMFVDNNIDLEADSRGNQLSIVAAESRSAEKIALEGLELDSFTDPRAQLGDQPFPVGDDEIARANPTGVPSEDGSRVYTGRLISLDLQDTDIDNALRIIAEVSNLNIIASDDVTGKVTLRLIDVPWDQALDVILKTNGLDQVTEGNVIRIAPVDKLRQEREARREALRAKKALEELKVKYVRISYARATELVDPILSVLSERGSVTVDERTNQVIVRDIQEGQDEADILIEKLDLRTPQVLLETQIVEGQRNILRDLGFQWNFNVTRSPATGNATGSNFPNSVSIGGSAGMGDTTSGPFVDFAAAEGATALGIDLGSADGSRSLFARITALETEGKVRIVSKPQVATVNNRRALISSVETIRVRLPDSGTSVATGSGASATGGGSTAFEEIDVGIQLSVTPQASPDYYVLLDIMAESSTFGDELVDGIPSTVEREATSTILVKSGMTFALGGVYRIQDSDAIEGVPWLKDIPFLGWAFRRSLTDKSDEELIFFLTPHIVEGSFDPGAMEVKDQGSSSRLGTP